MSEWQDISTAPKDRTVLVNDTTGLHGQWVAAHWMQGDEWCGWIYDDDLALDSTPCGPEPTHWLDVPPLPAPPEGGEG